MTQLDLFRDGRSVQLANALRQALLNEDAEAAAAASRELADFDAAHRWLPHARTLIAALQAPVPANEEEGLSVMDRLEAEWLPAAHAVLGDDSRDMLYRKWRSVGDALAGRPFDPAFPDHHASYAYQECEDWLSVERCVLAVPDFSTQPVLLERMAEAVWRQRRRKDAASYWFALCWCDPDRFQRLMDRDAVPDPAFRDGWERWQDQDFETDFSALWFPAWMLIHKPEIAKLTPVPEASNSPQAAFAVLRELTMGESEEMKLRKQLQRLHPGLLASYLKRR